MEVVTISADEYIGGTQCRLRREAQGRALGGWELGVPRGTQRGHAAGWHQEGRATRPQVTGRQMEQGRVRR